MAALLLGATGQLGTALTHRIGDVFTPTRTEVDLATLTRDSGRDLLEAIAPDVVINCAAWTAVDAAEEAEAEASTINGTAVGRLAEVADDAGIPFVTFSTDYVFDGLSQRPYREDDETAPLNAYGRSKLAGEHAALEYSRSLVIRTSWVQSQTHPCFIRTMLHLAEDRDELRVVDDQFGRPTFADDLATATLEALDNGVTGLLHVANEGATTWFGLASETLALAGFGTNVTPVPSVEFPTPAERPKYSVLDSSLMAEKGLTSLPSWQDSLLSAVESIIATQQ